MTIESNRLVKKKNLKKKFENIFVSTELIGILVECFRREIRNSFKAIKKKKKSNERIRKRERDLDCETKSPPPPEKKWSKTVKLS